MECAKAGSTMGSTKSFDDSRAQAFYQSFYQQNKVLFGLWIIGECVNLVTISDSLFRANDLLPRSILLLRGLATLGIAFFLLRRRKMKIRNPEVGKIFHWYARVACLFSVYVRVSALSRDDGFFASALVSSIVTCALGAPSLLERQLLTGSVLLSRADAFSQESIFVEIVVMSFLTIMATQLVYILHNHWQTSWLLSVQAQTMERTVGEGHRHFHSSSFGRVGDQAEKMRDLNFVRIVGHGAQGIVQEVTEPSTGLRFALKMCEKTTKNRETAATRLETEAMIMCPLQHVNVLRAFSMVKAPFGRGLLLELCEEITVRTLIRQSKLPPGAAANLARQAFTGAQYLHDQGVCHNDLKPANLLIKNNTLKIGDFGSAWVQGLEAGERLRGTPMYMAPEHVATGTLSRKSDIWSLGCCTMEMLTTLLPWDLLPETGEKNKYFFLNKLLYMREDPPIPECLSDLPHSFLRECLRIDLNFRPDASQLLHHPFLAQNIVDGQPVVVKEKVELEQSIEFAKTRQQQAKARASSVSKSVRLLSMIRKLTNNPFLDAALAWMESTGFFSPFADFEQPFASPEVERKFQEFCLVNNISFYATCVLPVQATFMLLYDVFHIFLLCMAGQYFEAIARCSLLVVPISFGYCAFTKQFRILRTIIVAVMLYIHPFQAFWFLHLGGVVNLAFVIVCWGICYASAMSVRDAALSGVYTCLARIVRIAVYYHQLGTPSHGSYMFREDYLADTVSVCAASFLCGYVYIVVREDQRRQFAARAARYGMFDALYGGGAHGTARELSDKQG